MDDIELEMVAYLDIFSKLQVTNSINLVVPNRPRSREKPSPTMSISSPTTLQVIGEILLGGYTLRIPRLVYDCRLSPHSEQ